MKKKEILKKPINLNEQLDKPNQDNVEHTRIATRKANALVGTFIPNGNSSGSSGKYVCISQGYNSGSGCFYWRCVDNDHPGSWVVVVAYCSDGWSVLKVD